MFCSIVSGSSGNASLITYNDTKILIDCGLSGKKLTSHLSELGVDINDIDALLITHEHNDHIMGAGVVSRRYDIPIYTTEATYKAMNIGPVKDDNVKIISSDTDFTIGDICVCPFSVSHDAKDPVGYSFILDNKKYSIATDMGIMTDEVFSAISGSDAVILEANHDINMLMYSEYPYMLKRRIMGNLGHLSNDVAAETAYRLLSSNTKNIMLSHLSDKNNEPNIAYKTVEAYLSSKGVKIDSDVKLSVANRYEVTSFI